MSAKSKLPENIITVDHTLGFGAVTTISSTFELEGLFVD
jgi:hypothetical protein